jgi:hypothetical protein
MFDSLEELLLNEKIVGKVSEEDTMLGILKYRYLNKVMDIEEFDSSIRELLMVDESNSILEYNIHDAIHNGFSYEANLGDKIGFDFKFKNIRHIGIPGEDIVVKIVDIGEY